MLVSGSWRLRMAAAGPGFGAGGGRSYNGDAMLIL
jgi:hypothetical protein